MRRTFYCSVIALLCAAAHAQTVSGFGEVTGKVSDTQFVGIPDTTVAVFNEALSVQRTMTTTDDGMFDAAALLPAKGYKLEVTRKGFEKWESGEFEVVLGRPVNFRITLLMDKEAPVEGAPSPRSILNEKTYDVYEALDQLDLDSLPTPTRRVSSLAILTPGTIEESDTGFVIFHGVRSTPALSIDGSSVTNLFQLQSPQAEQLPQDAIQSMQTIASGVSPEFGSTMDGAIDVAVRSGSDELHGSIYDFFNTHGWNAGNRYGEGFRPTGRQNQGGFGVGSHIRPDNLFWFLAGEAVDASTEGINRIVNPLIANPAGTAIPASNCTVSPTLTATQCAAAIKFISSQMNVVVPRSLTALSGVGKIDYHLGQSNTLNIEGDARHFNGRDWGFAGQIAPNGGMLGSNGNLGQEERHAKVGMLTELGTRALNDFRFTWFQDRLSDYSDPKLLPSTGPMAISVAGTSLGGSPSAPMTLTEHRYQLADHLTMPIYSTTFKAGFFYTRNTDAYTQLYDRFGAYDYPSLTAFAQDFSGNTAARRTYTSFGQTLGTAASNVTTPEYQMYIQGNWRALDKLIVTYGVAYDKENFRQPQSTQVNSAYYETGVINSPKKDFAPRIAAAYRFNDKTIFRLSGGDFFQPFIGNLINGLNTLNGETQNTLLLQPLQSGAPLFPHVLAKSSTYPAGSQDVVFALAKWKNPYTIQGSLSVERQLGKDATLTIGYVYSRSMRLWSMVDVNEVPSTTLETYLIRNAQGAQVGTFQSLMFDSIPSLSGKNSGSYAQALQVENEGNALYNSAFAQLRKRMSHGFSAQASYDWSHSKSDVNGPPVIGSIPSIPQATYNGDFRADQGPSSFDQRHRVTGSWVWEPKVDGQSSKALSGLVNGWQVSGTLIMASGLHETPTVIVNGQQFSSITMLYTNNMSGSGGWNRVPFDAVNSLPLGAQYDVDARLSRSFTFHERYKLTLMGEGFNLLNKQFNTSVNTVAYTATATLPAGLKNGVTSGTLTPVPGVGQGIAANGTFGTNARRAQVAFRFVF